MSRKSPARRAQAKVGKVKSSPKTERLRSETTAGRKPLKGSTSERVRQSPTGVVWDELKSALALLLRISKSQVTDSLLKKYIQKIQRDACDVASLVGKYQMQRAEKLRRIGISGSPDTERYQEVENQVLVDLYSELQRPRPSPTRLLQRSIQYALDARKAIKATTPQIDVRATKSGYEVTIYRPDQIRIRSLPCPGEVVEDPFAVRLLSLMLTRPVDYVEVMEFIEMRLPHPPQAPENIASERPIFVEECVVFLHGRPIPVDDLGARFVKQLVGEPNNWLSTNDLARDDLLRMSRVARVYKRLAKPIKELIESKRGKGYRFVSARLA
jgi:predicted secreted protein